MTPKQEQDLILSNDLFTQRSSVLSKYIQSTALKLQSRLQDKPSATHSNTTIGNISNEIDSTLVIPDNSPSISEIDQPVVETDFPKNTQIEPLILVAERPGRTIAGPDLHFLSTLVPGYSPATHSTSLQEILANKGLSKVIISLPEIDNKKIRKRRDPKNLEEIVPRELREFVHEDRHSQEALCLLNELKSYETMGLLPNPSMNLGFTTTLPPSIQRYLRCLIKFLAVHPALRENNRFSLTAYQETAYKRIYDIFCDRKHWGITKNLETWVKKTQHLYYKGSRSEHREYAENREGKISQNGYKHVVPSFLKEFVIVDLLNGDKHKKTGKQRYISSDYDDKHLGFDIVCKDKVTKSIGLADLTFNPHWVRGKSRKLDTFIEENRFNTSEFNNYISQNSETPVDKVHTAVLFIDKDKFLYSFLSYISRVKNGKYSVCKTLEKISDRPLPRIRQNCCGKKSDKEFFSEK